jgi:hypothetical protein
VGFGRGYFGLVGEVVGGYFVAGLYNCIEFGYSGKNFCSYLDF